jgi:hypothetical protein
LGLVGLGCDVMGWVRGGWVWLGCGLVVVVVGGVKRGENGDGWDG